MTSPASITFSREEELLASQQDRRGYYLKMQLPAKLAMDAAYSRDIRMATDLGLIWETIARLLCRQATGVASEKGLSESHEKMV